MSASVWTEGYDLNSVADRVLNIATRFWFVIAVGGQWIFAYYVAAFYGGAALRGDLQAWNKVMPHGYVPGDIAGNIAIAVHLFLAFVIIVGGPLQLIPQIRRHAPAFHRWNGRVYMPAVFLTSLAGLYMVWSRGTVGDVVQHLGITLDAILIMVFAVLALRYAMAREIQTHRRWALRLFMVVNAVWFFRVGLMFWIVVNQGPVGFDPKTFKGPFLSFWAFADYLLPLAILELYFRTRDRAGATGRFAMAAALFVLTIALGIGIVVATMGMWLPRI
jgi:hypothetical protein